MEMEELEELEVEMERVAVMVRLRVSECME